jgi:TetR/AcrR family transcriptional regulator
MDESSGTKDTIIKIALSLFSRRGYEPTGIQEIVEAAGITKPTLYYYFGSKQGLLEVIVAEYGEVLLGIARKEADYHHDLVMNLTGFFRETLRFALERQDFFRLMMGLFFSAPETPAFAAGKKLREDRIGILEGLFATASRDHGNMKNRQKVYAESFLGLIQTWGVLAVNGEMEWGDHLLYRIIHQYMHGIFS